MEESYKAKVNENFNFQFELHEPEELDVHEFSKDKFHILKDSVSVKAEITEKDFLQREYSVKVNSNYYSVKISNPLDILIEEMGLSLQKKQVINLIKAPMPGSILEVNIQEGDNVKEGDFLLVLEAMKMENTITAPRDAVVKSVNVKKGENVNKNQVLIEME